MSDQHFERLMNYVVLPLLIIIAASLTFGAAVSVVAETIGRIGGCS